MEGLPADLRTLSLSIAGRSALPVPGRTDLSAWHSGLSARADLPLNGTFLPEYEGPIIEGKLIDTRTGEAVTTPGVQTLLGFVGEETRVFGGQQQADHGSVLFLTKRIDGSGEPLPLMIPWRWARARDRPIGWISSRPLPFIPRRRCHGSS